MFIDSPPSFGAILSRSAIHDIHRFSAIAHIRILFLAPNKHPLSRASLCKSSSYLGMSVEGFRLQCMTIQVAEPLGRTSTNMGCIGPWGTDPKTTCEPIHYPNRTSWLCDASCNFPRSSCSNLTLRSPMGASKPMLSSRHRRIPQPGLLEKCLNNPRPNAQF